MRRQVGATLGVIGMVSTIGLLSGCMSDQAAAGFTAPEDYETVEQLVSDADVVAVVQAGDQAVDVVDKVPYTRTELKLRKVLLGVVAKNAHLAVTQVGSTASPPGAGLAAVLRDGHEYVGPGVWRADTLGTSLTLHTTMLPSVPPAIPHVTTPWALEVELGEAGESLGTSVIGSY
jgi:hypothetical protein